ncbi:MAG: hypothetical protein KKA05_00500, partial [Alphaproteobacteria bacterium]|nr:hypothetical protein [Alphaproteobacteria bacterium]
MKKFAYALILSTAIMSAPAMANDETQHNTHGRYSYYASDAHYSDIARLDRHNVMNIQTALH